MDGTLTDRGFARFEGVDRYGHAYSLQKSSLAFEDAVWLGIDDAAPQVMASQVSPDGVGWVPVDVDALLGVAPGSVHCTTRMHLTREMVAELIPMLQHFVETGELPTVPPAEQKEV